MAFTQQGESLTEAHRLAQIGVSREVLSQLLVLWPLLSEDNIDDTRGQWLEAAAAAVTVGATKSVEVARRYYERFRAAEIGGLIPTDLLDIDTTPDVARIVARLESAGPIEVKQATARGSAAPASEALVKVLGTAQRETLQPGRDAIVDMMAEDRRARRFARVTSARACAFCLMLASRGPVYAEAAGRFRTHRACACSLEPEFDRAGRYNLPPSTFGASQMWDDYLRDRNENPDRYVGLAGPIQHGDRAGEMRTASEANALGFRRFVDGSGPMGQPATPEVDVAPPKKNPKVPAKPRPRPTPKPPPQPVKPRTPVEKKAPTVFDARIKLGSVEAQIAYFERTGELPGRLEQLYAQRAELQAIIDAAT